MQFIQLILALFTVYLTREILLEFFSKNLSSIGTFVFALFPLNVYAVSQISTITIQIFLLNIFLICYFLLFMITGIMDQFSSSDPATKIFFNIDLLEILLLLTFCLFLPIINMRLIYENYSFNR